MLPSYWKSIAFKVSQIFPLVLAVRITWRRVTSTKGNPKYSFENLPRCHFARPPQIWSGIEPDTSLRLNVSDLIHGTVLRADIYLNCIVKFRFLPHRKLNSFSLKRPNSSCCSGKYELVFIFGNRAKHKTIVWQNAGFLLLKPMVRKEMNSNSSSIFSPGRQTLWLTASCAPLGPFRHKLE